MNSALYYLLRPDTSIIIMLIWYIIGIQYERGGFWKALAPFTFIGFLYDCFLQRTWARIWFWEIEPSGEFTITMRLCRLVFSAGWRGRLARLLARVLNFFAPNHQHVPTAGWEDVR
jgi:hypothetical protein